MERECMRIVGKSVCLMAILALLIQASPALADVNYDSSINFYKDGAYDYIDSDGADDSHVSYQSFSGGIGSGWTLVNGESFGFTHGYADAGSLKQGAFAQIISSENNYHFSDARMSTEASNRLTVLQGSSGLNEGDTTILTLKIRLDGALHTEATSYPGKGWAHAEMDAGLSVRDYAIQIDTGEGMWTPSQASFGASCELESYDVSFPYWGYNYSSNWDKSWSYESNIDSGDSYRISDGTKYYGDSFHYQEGLSFDTGEITLNFEAIVGHTLDFESDMYLYVDANNDAMSWADFSNTFVLDVTAANGVALQWQVVPEPATMLLLAFGGLVIRRKR
ncbi:MAG: PEP-CTERM sorting domain-containing protein [Anaerohalosphaeraceae bacterium]